MVVHWALTYLPVLNRAGPHLGREPGEGLVELLPKLHPNPRALAACRSGRVVRRCFALVQSEGAWSSPKLGGAFLFLSLDAEAQAPARRRRQALRLGLGFGAGLGLDSRRVHVGLVRMIG